MKESRELGITLKFDANGKALKESMDEIRMMLERERDDSIGRFLAAVGSSDLRRGDRLVYEATLKVVLLTDDETTPAPSKQWPCRGAFLMAGVGGPGPAVAVCSRCRLPKECHE